ncbi:MAG: HD family phosphohydrolase [Candidatus Cryosericum sp.]
MTRQNRITGLARTIRHSIAHRVMRFRRIGTLVFILVALLSAVLCALPFVPVRRSVSKNTIVSADMVSRRDIVYVDNARTADLRKRASDEVAPIYTFDGSRLTTATTSLDNLMTKIFSVRAQNEPVDEESQEVAALLGTTEGATTKYLVTCSESEVQSSTTAARQALTTVMGRGVLEGSLPASRESINTELKKYSISSNQVRSAYLLAVRFLTSNLIYDETATQLARERAASSVSPVVSTILAGTPVVKKGTVLDQSTVDLLLSTGLVWGPRALQNVVSQMLVALLAWGTIALAVVLLGSAKDRTQHMFMETGVIGGSCIMISWLTGTMASTMTPFFLCLLLGFVFFEGTLATVFGFALLVLTWIMVPMPAEVLSGLVVGAIAVFIILRKVNKVSAVLIAGPIAGASAALVYSALAGLTEQRLSVIVSNAGYLIAGGVIAAVFALGLTLVFERLFNVATVVRLRELLDTGSKLLAQLFESAPGTYHHSLNVANLAAGAAQRIGANWLMARVGGYYHDIGKLLHPQFFGENRGELPNIHEDISPELSTKVILEHVQAGVTIARSYHLPPEVVDVIAEHHGTTVVQFFYDKASAERANLSPDAFRYQGPKPHTRESSLVFLADGVEAAARSLSKVDKPGLEELIDTIVSARIADGQLAESQLTLGEIATVKEYFLTSLVSFYHVRDAYPTPEEANERT